MDKVYELKHVVKFEDREKPYSIRIHKTRHANKGMYFKCIDIGEYTTKEEALEAIGGKVELEKYYIDTDMEIDGDLLR